MLVGAHDADRTRKVHSHLRRLSVVAALTLVAVVAGAAPMQPTAAQESDTSIVELTLTSDWPGRLQVSWDEPSSVPDDYRVNWAKSNEDFPSFRAGEGNGNGYPTTNSFDLTGLEQGAEYKVRVRARYRDPASAGPWSAEARLVVSSAPTVSGLRLESNSAGALSVSWDAATPAPTDYRMNWAKSSDNFPSHTSSHGNAYPTTNSHDVDGLDAGVEYKVRVRARYGDGVGSGSWSDTATVTVASAATENSSATGAPTITGTAQVGQTLTADTSNIADDDGLDNVSYSYQWVRSSGNADVDISDATDVTYTLVDDDQGKTIKVRVSFTDEAGQEESLTSGVTDPVAAKPPNVVLILADDLGWGAIESNNPDSAMTTPRIDSIAAEGVRFSDAHSPSAVCSPTRYGLLTGRYAWRSWLETRVLAARDRPMIGPGVPTLGTLLQGQGYRTAAIGKWHLGMEFVYLSDIRDVNDVNRGVDLDADIVDSPIDHGFDQFFGTRFGLNVYIQGRRFVANPETAPETSPGFFKYVDVMGRITEEAVSFIEQEGQTDEPFFLYLPLNAVHVPHHPSAQFKGSTGLGAYADFVAEMDWSVGRVLDALERVGASEDTLVIFTSDNGGENARISNHVDHRVNGPWRGSKTQIFEGGHRVPLLMRWPKGIASGSTVDATISLTDMYATLADIVGEEPAPGVAPDSVSLMPLLDGEVETRGEPVVHHSNIGMFALRDGRWKLIFGDGHGGALFDSQRGHPWGRPWQLYDLEEDPGEQDNLAEDHPEVVAQMHAALLRILAAEDGTRSSDARLESLTLAGIDFGPFDRDVQNYTVLVDPSITTIEVSAIPVATDARLFLEWGPLPHQWHDRGRRQVRLAEGTTTITIRVRPPDRSGDMTYTVNVTRSKPNRSATGVPAINGTAEIGETLTAATADIVDADGLNNVSYSYQWMRGDDPISGATASAYTLTGADAGQDVRVRVSFNDNAGNREALTSEPVPVPLAPVWSATMTVGTINTRTPAAAGYTLFGYLGTVHPSNVFKINGKTVHVINLSVEDGALNLVTLWELPSDFVLTVDDQQFVTSASKAPSYVGGSAFGFGKYRWPADGISWAAGDSVSVSLTPAGDLNGRPPERDPAPPTMFFHGQPASHDGTSSFKLRIYFSQDIDIEADELRSHAIQITGGSITKAAPLYRGSPHAWELTVAPTTTEDITIAVSPPTDCNQQGAICTAGGLKLFNDAEITVPGPDGITGPLPKGSYRRE